MRGGGCIIFKAMTFLLSFGLSRSQQGKGHMHRIYDSRRWRRLRALKLSLDPICQYCRQAPATVADHARRVKDGCDPWDISNLVASCWSCHQSKRQAEKTGRAFTGRRIKSGVDAATGLPLDGGHWWRRE
ncbi:MAG: HNH endonuclease [Candidatus Binatia bacterium]